MKRGLHGQYNKQIPTEFTKADVGTDSYIAWLHNYVKGDGCSGLDLVTRYFYSCYSKDEKPVRKKLMEVAFKSQAELESLMNNYPFMIHQIIQNMECVVPGFAGEPPAETIGTAFGGRWGSGLFCRHMATRKNAGDDDDHSVSTVEEEDDDEENDKEDEIHENESQSSGDSNDVNDSSVEDAEKTAARQDSGKKRI